jgi:hypothetical protein
MRTQTTDIDDLIDVIARYTTQIVVTSMPSGAMTGSVQYGNMTRSIGDRRHSEDAVIRGLYQMIKDDMYRECFLVEKLKMVPVNLDYGLIIP